MYFGADLNTFFCNYEDLSPKSRSLIPKKLFLVSKKVNRTTFVIMTK